MKRITFFIPREFHHAARRVLLENIPESFNFILQKGMEQNKVDITKINKRSIFKNIIYHLRTKYVKICDFLKIPVFSIRFSRNESLFNYYLDNFCLIISKRKFVSYQLESVADLVEYKFEKLNSRLCLALLKRYILSNRCKYIFCMSEACRRTAIELLNIPNNRREKFQTIYPSIKPFEFEKQKEDNKVRLLYIASINKKDPDFNFYMKGGKLVIESFQKLKKSHKNLELHFKGYIPPKYKDLLKSIDSIFNYGYVSDEKLNDLYKTADIFLFPTYGDTYGYTLIEAMAHGLPIICIKNFAAPELVINNETGFTINSSQKFLFTPFNKIYPEWISKRIYYNYLRNEDDKVALREIIEKIEILIINKELRQKLGENGKYFLLNGRISVKERNKKLINLFINK